MQKKKKKYIADGRPINTSQHNTLFVTSILKNNESLCSLYKVLQIRARRTVASSRLLRNVKKILSWSWLCSLNSALLNDVKVSSYLAKYIKKNKSGACWSFLDIICVNQKSLYTCVQKTLEKCDYQKLDNLSHSYT